MHRKVFYGGLIFGITALIISLGAWKLSGNARTATDKFASIAVPQGNKVPPREWMETYSEWKALADELAAIEKDKGLQEKRDRLNGMASRLRAQIPPAYDWDEDTRTFRPSLPIASSPAVATPAKK